MIASVPEASGPDLLQVVLSLNAGGTERLVVDMTLALNDRANIVVACLDERGVWAEHLRNEGIRVEALGRKPGFDWSLVGSIRRIAKDMYKPAIHCHHYTPFVYGGLASLAIPDSKLVYTEHGRYGDGPPSVKRRFANQLFGRMPGRFFAVSHDLRQHLVGEGLPAAKLEVNHNGIEPGAVTTEHARSEVRDELGLHHDDWVVGTVARLDPVKDLNVLIDAVAQLKDRAPKLKVVFVGDGPERQNLEAAVEAQGLAARVIFLGHRDDARRLMAGFDLYFNCSVIEGISVTILEALAAGLAVAASRVGGTPEILGDNEYGLMFESRSPKAAAHTLLRLYEN
ncbi:MAG: glycosyltransferase, partial [Gammaproteobacteria bacterium]